MLQVSISKILFLSILIFLTGCTGLKTTSTGLENEAFIDSIAFDNLKKDDEIIQKDESINQLNETITTTLSELESNVANQINNINTAQDAEITALKSQIAALQSTITSLRASKPPVLPRGTGTITTNPVPTFGGPNPANAGPPSLSGT